METLDLTIGNSENNCEIKVDDPMISYAHAKVIGVLDDRILIKDLNSKNGTLVNGRFIKTKLIEATDIIKMGQNSFLGKELIDQTVSFLNKGRIQFFQEFEELHALFNEYETQQKKLSASYKFKVSIVRFGLPAVFLITFIVFGEKFGIPPNLRIVVPVLGGGIASLFADKLFSQEEFKSKLQQHREHFQERLLCPKCNLELISRSFDYWKRKRKCPKCKANWID
jgi:hypothetical protein